MPRSRRYKIDGAGSYEALTAIHSKPVRCGYCGHKKRDCIKEVCQSCRLNLPKPEGDKKP